MSVQVIASPPESEPPPGSEPALARQPPSATEPARRVPSRRPSYATFAVAIALAAIVATAAWLSLKRDATPEPSDGTWAEGEEKIARAWPLEPRDAMLASRDAIIRLGLRRYPEAQHAIARSLSLEPDQAIAYVLAVWHTWLSKGDLVAARAMLDRLPATDDWRFMELRFLQALFERRFDEARRVQAPWSGQWMRH